MVSISVNLSPSFHSVTHFYAFINCWCNKIIFQLFISSFIYDNHTPCIHMKLVELGMTTSEMVFKVFIIQMF